MMWLTSLILLVLLDALPFWFDYTPLTTQLINLIFGPGTIPPILRDVIRAAFFGILAIAILLLKSKRMDLKFRIACRCSVLTCILGLAANIVLMGAFIYGHLI